MTGDYCSAGATKTHPFYFLLECNWRSSFVLPAAMLLESFLGKKEEGAHLLMYHFG